MLFRRRFTHCAMTIPFILLSLSLFFISLARFESLKVTLACYSFCLLHHTNKQAFLLNAQVLNYECKCMHVHNLDLNLSTLFIETTSIGREFHILITDGKNEC